MRSKDRHRSSMSSGILVLRIICLPLIVAALSGCLSMKAYVDPALGDVKPEEIIKPVAPQPVQVLFEFQTNGAPNTRATEAFKQPILDVVGHSKVFSSVSDAPITSGDLLSIVINNVADVKEASAKGMTTGLTFGLAGSMVTDRYVCTMTFNPGGKPPIKKSVDHAIHTTVGNADGPPGLTPYPTLRDAATKAFEQMVLNGLKQLSRDAAFRRR